RPTPRTPFLKWWRVGEWSGAPPVGRSGLHDESNAVRSQFRAAISGLGSLEPAGQLADRRSRAQRLERQPQLTAGRPLRRPHPQSEIVGGGTIDLAAALHQQSVGRTRGTTAPAVDSQLRPA